MRYFIIAGEASGDAHGARLIEELKKLDSKATFEFWGGDIMASSASKPPLKHIKKLAFMGFVEVVKNLFEILSNFRLVKRQIQEFRPDRVIFIDYPGFNLRILPWCKKQGFITKYYISPTVWAWHSSRKEIIRKYADDMMVILPFEKTWYHNHGIEVQYVGNPSFEEVSKYEIDQTFISRNDFTKPIISLLPGSRKQEIDLILPPMLESVRKYQNSHHIVIAKPRFVDIEIYKNALEQCPELNIHIIEGEFYNLLSCTEVALVASGTATLEAALFHVPQVVCYKTSKLNFLIAKSLVNIKYISLVNLICNREVVKELIQDDCNKNRISRELDQLLKIIPAEKEFFYEQLFTELNFEGSTAANVAKIVFER